MSRGPNFTPCAFAFLAVALFTVPLRAVQRGGKDATTTTTTTTTITTTTTTAAKLKNPVKSSAESIAAGEKVYKKYCKFCHGDDAKGNGALAPKGTHPPDLTDVKWDHGSTDGDIFASIRDGIGPKFDMDTFEGTLSVQDMWNVVNFIKTLSAKKP